jgi:hypothetical protein
MRQARVIDAHELKDGRVQIAYVDRLFHGLEPEIVGCALGHPPFNATACQPHGESERIVIAAVLRDIDVGEGSVWVTSFEFPISRIDPDTNKVVQQFAGPGGDALRVGLGSVWLSNLKAQTVWRIDPLPE